MKQFLLAKLNQVLIRYLNLLIRHDCTTKHRGEDAFLDDSILFLSLTKVYGLSIDEMNLQNYDETIICSIEKKLTKETKEELEKIKINYDLYISSIKKLAKNHRTKFTKIPILTLLLLIFRIKKKSRKLYNYFRELHRTKLILSSELIHTFFAVIIPTIILGSLLRQYLFSIAFNYPMGLVYSFDDYLSSSISSIILIVIPIIITSILSVVIIINDRGHDPINITYSAKSSVRDLKILSLFTILLLAFTFFIHHDVFYIISPILIFFLLLQPLTNFLIKNFSNAKSIFFYITLIFTFFISIYSTTQYEIRNLKNEKFIYDVSVVSTDNNLYKDYTLITYGSRHIVLYNKNTFETLLINSGEIKNIYIDNRIK